jgi:hypothetical protein
VDEDVVAALGIQPIGQMKLSTPSQSRPAWVYAVRLSCSEVAMPVLEVLDIVGCTLQPQGFIALLGRNFLRKSFSSATAQTDSPSYSESTPSA